MLILNPNRQIFVISLFFLALDASANSDTACNNLYSKVTYALAHTKKAMKATNFEHQTYYAERALISLEKSEKYISQCGCIKAEDSQYLTAQNLKKAIDPFDWDAGRFYTKKSMQQIKEFITILDQCSMQKSTAQVEEIIVKESEELDKWVATADSNISFLQRQMKKMLSNFESQNKNQESEGLKSQQKMYAARMRKLLESNLQKLQTIENNLTN